MNQYRLVTLALLLSFTPAFALTGAELYPLPMCENDAVATAWAEHERIRFEKEKNGTIGAIYADFDGNGQCDVMITYDDYPLDEPYWRKELPAKYFFASPTGFTVLFEELTVARFQIRAFVPYGIKHGGPPYLVVVSGDPIKYGVSRWNPQSQSFEHFTLDPQDSDKSHPSVHTVLRTHNNRLIEDGKKALTQWYEYEQSGAAEKAQDAWSTAVTALLYGPDLDLRSDAYDEMKQEAMIYAAAMQYIGSAPADGSAIRNMLLYLENHPWRTTQAAPAFLYGLAHEVMVTNEWARQSYAKYRKDYANHYGGESKATIPVDHAKEAVESYGEFLKLAPEGPLTADVKQRIEDINAATYKPTASTKDILDVLGLMADVSGPSKHETADRAAEGPGFDCKKAQSPTEKAICADSNLSRADYQMARAYKILLAKISHRKAAALKAEQRAWLKAREGTCTASGKADTVCLLAETKARTQVLRQQED